MKKQFDKYLPLRIFLFVFKMIIFGAVAIVCSDIVFDSELSWCYNIFEYAVAPIKMREVLFVCLVPVIIFTVSDILVARKAPMSYPEKYLPLIIDLIVSVVVLFVSKTEWLGLTYMILLIITLRVFTLLIELIITKKFRAIAVVLLLIFVCVLSYSLLSMYQDELREEIAGVPDATGSWSSINQEVARNSDWQQIVSDSSFSVKFTDEYQDDYVCLCYSDTYPVIDGSTVCVPLAVEFARQHLNMDDETANSFVNFSTTHEAYLHLINKTADQWFRRNDQYYKFVPSGEGTDIFIGTQPSSQEIDLAAENGVEFVKKAVCYDAFVFITHKDNPIDSLTVEQIQQIYSGETVNWEDVGGANKRIKAYQREANSGSQTAMEQLVMQGIPMSDPIEVPVIIGMGQLIDTVAEYENNTASIGYTYKYYIDTLYKNENIKTISVNGIEPTDENIRSGKYPFSTCYYGVIRRGDEEKTGGRFLDWIVSEEGQKCVAQAGYIPIFMVDS